MAVLNSYCLQCWVRKGNTSSPQTVLPKYAKLCPSPRGRINLHLGGFACVLHCR
jgi:hypothetical protein